jgi:hypothetical protein
MQYSLNKEILVIISNSRVEYTTLFYCCEVAHKRSLASSYNEQHISRSSINMCTLDDVCVCERPLPPRINMCTLDDVCVCERPLPRRNRRSWVLNVFVLMLTLTLIILIDFQGHITLYIHVTLRAMSLRTWISRFNLTALWRQIESFKERLN